LPDHPLLFKDPRRLLKHFFLFECERWVSRIARAAPAYKGQLEWEAVIRSDVSRPKMAREIEASRSPI
jgi:hypothetical protein